MPQLTWKKAALFIVSVLTAMTLLAIFSELLLVAVDSFVQGRLQPFGYRTPTFLMSAEAQYVEQLKKDIALNGWPEQRRVVIDLSETEATADFSFVLDRDHRWTDEVLDGDFIRYPRPVVETVFGLLIVQHVVPRDDDFQEPFVEIDSQTGSVTMHYPVVRSIDPQTTVSFLPSSIRDWSSTLYELFGLPPWPQDGGNLEMIVNYPGRRLVQVRPFPYARSQDTLRLQTRDLGGDALVSVETAWIGSEPATTAQDTSRQQVLRRVGGLLNRPVARRLLGSLLEALPLLFFLGILWRWEDRLPASLVLIAEVVLALLALHFVYYVGAAIHDGIDELTGFRERLYIPLYRALHLPRPSVPEPLGHLGTAIALMSVLIPALLIRRSRQWEAVREDDEVLTDPFEPGNRPSTRSRRFSAADVVSLFTYLLIGLLIAYPLIYALSLPRGTDFLDALWSEPGGDFLVFSFQVGLLGALLMLLTAFLYELLDGRPVPGWVVPLAFWVMLLGNLIWSIENALKQRTETDIAAQTSRVWLIYALVVGAPLVYAFVRLAYTLARRARRRPAMDRIAHIGIVVLAIVFAFPMRLLYSPSAPAASYQEALNLAGQLDNLIKFIFLAGLVWFFYEQGKEGPALNDLTLTVGLIAGVTMMHPAGPAWLFIPLRFLLGYWLLSIYMRPAGYWTEQLKPLYQRVFTNRRKFLERIVELRREERTYQEVYEAKRAKVGKDELKYTKFKKEMDTMREQLDGANEKAKVRGKPIQDVALAFGPHPTAWKNGLHGAQWAALFSLPWMAIWVYNFMTGQAVSSAYPLWSFIAELLNLLIRWLGIGFFFGYFYPFLYGKNGLQKGIWLWLVIVVPALPLALIDNSTTTAWQGFLFWVLQVFIHSMLLGLIAFDYVTLRQGYRDLQMLFELHGIPSVGISISTVLLAIGTAVTTLLQSRGEEIVTTALTFILPSLDTLRNTMP